MSRINFELLSIAESIQEKLKNRQESEYETDFEISLPEAGEKTKVESDFKAPRSVPRRNRTSIGQGGKSKSLMETNDSKDDGKESLNLPPELQSANLKETPINSTNFLSADDLSEDDELWLIMTPKNFKFKKQHVEMSGRQELKGGKFEIEFFNSASNNNMANLICKDNKFVSGPSFKGCIQISEKLQTFEPVYHEHVLKENPIPDGLKQRYIPFGADINSNKATERKTEESENLESPLRKKRKRKHSTGALDNLSSTNTGDVTDASPSKDMKLIDSSDYSTSGSKKKKKKKKKHSEIE